MLVAGIDPGLSGALAVIDSNRYADCTIDDLPTLALMRGGKAKRKLDLHALADLLRRDKIDHLFIEQVGAMPGQGSSSIFSFGQTYGAIEMGAAAIGIPYTLVTPAKWKRDLGVPASKDGARAIASQRLPFAAHHWPLVKHDGRAESALLALWGIRSLGLVRL